MLNPRSTIARHACPVSARTEPTILPGQLHRGRIRVGLIGYGYWGPNLARNFSAHAGSELAVICDTNPVRVELAHQSHPWARTTTCVDEVFEDSDIDLVVVATPPETHRDLGVRALRSGKHVLIEKPLATSVADALELVATAKECGRHLMVDHTFLFTGAVERMKRYVDEGELGELLYFDSTRINLGLFQSETNVIWDLAPHDISILLHLIDQPVKRVTAVGSSHVNTTVENIAYLTMQFDGHFLAHCHVNWLSPVKVRKTIVGGSRKMLVFDDMEASEKLKLYDSGADLVSPDDVYQSYVEYRTGDILVPKLEKSEALAKECDHVLAVLAGKEQPISGGELGVEVVRVLEAAERSLRLGGIPVELNDEARA